jgi:hypothetical protein
LRASAGVASSVNQLLDKREVARIDAIQSMLSTLRKLIAKRPEELAFRAGRRLSMAWERLGYRLGRYDWAAQAWVSRLCAHAGERPDADGLAAWWRRHMRTRHEPPFVLDAAELAESAELYGQLFGDRLNSVVATAERACRGEFSFLGIEFSAPDPIDWHRDQKSGRPWPRGFHADVDIFHGDVGSGDVKHVWELNRQETLIDCGKAYCLTGEPRYVRRVFAVIASWIAANPYLDGVNWSSALEVAQRSLSWLWAYQFCRSWDGAPADLHLEWIQSLYRHGAYLHRHLSFYFSPYNHLIGEATGLYLLGCFFPEFDEAAAWRERGWGVLEREITNQFHDDGGNVEQATFYHHYCLGFYLLALLARQRREESVPQMMRERIERAVEFSMWMTQPDGTVPRIGDVDDARSIRFENPPLWDFRNLVSLGAAVFRRSDMKAVAGRMSEDVLWLLGPAGCAAYDRLPAVLPSEMTKAFRTAGYFVARSGWKAEDHFLCFDCGPLAAGLHAADVPSVAHGHADLLSFTAYAFGRPLVVDGGFYTYNEDPHWHRYFRETPAHNTICVDGASQAKFTGPIAWSCVASPGPARFATEGPVELCECSHAGFHGLAEHVRHRRAILWRRGDYWLVADRLEVVRLGAVRLDEGASRTRGWQPPSEQDALEHDVEVLFHFAPSRIDVATDGRSAMVTTAEGVGCLVQSVMGDGLSMEVIQGGDTPAGGWIGTSYGRRQRAPILRLFGRRQLPASICVVLAPLGKIGAARIEPLAVTDAEGRALDDAVGCRVTWADGEDIVAFCWDTTGIKKVGGLAFEGRVLAASAGEKPRPHDDRFADAPVAEDRTVAARSHERVSHPPIHTNAVAD